MALTLAAVVLHLRGLLPYLTFQHHFISTISFFKNEENHLIEYMIDKKIITILEQCLTNGHIQKKSSDEYICIC